MYKYAHIGIYADVYDNLFGIPCGDSKKYGIAYLHNVLTLKAPYSVAELEKFILSVFGKCYFEQHREEDVSALETHLKIKGYANASRGLRFVFISRTPNEGYRFVPADRAESGYYTHIEKEAVNIKLEYNDGALAEAFKRVLLYSKSPE